MTRLISSLPAELQGIGARIDSLTGVGNRDRSVSLAEVDAATARAAVDTASFSDLDRDALRRLGRALQTSSSQPAALIERAVGPDGIHKSKLYPPENHVQREVIEFRTPISFDNLGNSGLEVPRTQNGAGVIGVRATTTTHSRSAPSFSIGGEKVPVHQDDQVRRDRAPIHGPLLMRGDAGTAVKSVEIFYQVPSPQETTDYFPINKTLRAGETHEIELSPFRTGKGIDLIENKWTARYAVPDPSGRRSEEGKPFYLDGVYCDVLLVDGAGQERRLDRTRFVDENEVDNVHDLGGVQGEKIRLKFFAKNAEGTNHPVTLQSVRVRYEGPTPVTPPKRFPIGRVFEPGQVAAVDLPEDLRQKKIGRVDVRWTDMLSGTWTRPGYATGTLMIDGRRIGAPEGVQSPETQSFTYVGGLKAETGKVGVAIDRDKARVDWIEVHFED